MGFFDMIGNMAKSAADTAFSNKVGEYRRISSYEIEELIPSIQNRMEKLCAIVAIAAQGDTYKAVNLAKDNNISKNILTKYATNRQWGEPIRRMIKEYDD